MYQNFAPFGRRCIQHSRSTSRDSQRTRIPDPPSDCCMRGCANCVWVSYAEELTELYKDSGKAAFEAVKEISDPSLRSFVELELKLKLGSK